MWRRVDLIVHGWRQSGSWSWTERGIALQALVLLPALTLSVRLVGYQAVRRGMKLTLPQTLAKSNAGNNTRLAENAMTEALRIGRLVNGAARCGPFPANCLVRSLTVWWLLARRGVPSELVIGAHIEPSGLRAHAWVECDRQVINDRSDVAEWYRPFELQSGSRRFV